MQESLRRVQKLENASKRIGHATNADISRAYKIKW